MPWDKGTLVLLVSQQEGASVHASPLPRQTSPANLLRSPVPRAQLESLVPLPLSGRGRRAVGSLFSTSLGPNVGLSTAEPGDLTGLAFSPLLCPRFQGSHLRRNLSLQALPVFCKQRLLHLVNKDCAENTELSEARDVWSSRGKPHVQR